MLNPGARYRTREDLLADSTPMPQLIRSDRVWALRRTLFMIALLAPGMAGITGWHASDMLARGASWLEVVGVLGCSLVLVVGILGWVVWHRVWKTKIEAHGEHLRIRSGGVAVMLRLPIRIGRSTNGRMLWLIDAHGVAVDVEAKAFPTLHYPPMLVLEPNLVVDREVTMTMRLQNGAGWVFVALIASFVGAGTALMTGLWVPYPLLGEFVDEGRQLSVAIMEPQPGQSELQIYTNPSHNPGFLQIDVVGHPDASVTRHESWAGRTWYSAAIVLPQTDRVEIDVRRGQEGSVVSDQISVNGLTGQATVQFTRLD